MSVTRKIPTLTDAQILSRIAALEKRRTLKAAIEADLAAAPAPILELEFISGLQIEDKVCGGLIPFRLWSFQKDLIGMLNANERLVVLKARQLGITWVVLAHALYCGTFWGNRLFLIVSQTGDDAIAALERIRIMVNSMPPEWRPEMIKNNTEEILFANGSRFRAMMATKRAGRSHAPFMTIADEVAFWEPGWTDLLMTSLEASAQRLFAVTTGNGPEDYMHRLWRKAVVGEGTWEHVFFPWSVHPDRDDAWYEDNVLQSSEPRLARREFAATAEEAFAAPEGIYFQRFERARHVRDIEVQRAWPTFRSIDHGFHHPACLWEQVSPAGQVFVVDEYLPQDISTTEFAKGIVDHEAAWSLAMAPRASYCDIAGNAVNVQTTQSEFDVLRRFRLAPRGQRSSVRDGCVLIMDSLADPDLPLVISERCVGLIRCLSQVKPDKSHPELYDQREDSPFQHALDALRYFYVNHRGGGESGANAVGGMPTGRDRSGF